VCSVLAVCVIVTQGDSAIWPPPGLLRPHRTLRIRAAGPHLRRQPGLGIPSCGPVRLKTWTEGARTRRGRPAPQQTATADAALTPFHGRTSDGSFVDQGFADRGHSPAPPNRPKVTEKRNSLFNTAAPRPARIQLTTVTPLHNGAARRDDRLQPAKIPAVSTQPTRVPVGSQRH